MHPNCIQMTRLLGIFVVCARLTRFLVNSESCEPGKYGNDQNCRECPPGTYTDADGYTICLGCPEGYFQNAWNSIECYPCEIHTFSTEISTTVCKDCPIGWLKTNESTMECEECYVGFFGIRSGHGCRECPGGFYQNLTGKYSCTECGLGQHQNLARSVSCKDCAPGQYQDVGAGALCKFCPEDSIQPNTASTECVKCPKGFIPHDQTCVQCEQGKYSFQGECEDCPLGMYQNEEADQCKDCAPGKYADENGRIQCGFCPAGYYQGTPGQSSCPFCPAGYYQNSFTQSECKLCPTGTYVDFSSADASSHCKSCPSGYGYTALRRSCRACNSNGDNKISTAGGACVGCASGKFTSDAITCKHCPFGYIANSGGVCETCPGGFSTTTTSRSSCQPKCSSANRRNTDTDNCEACPTGFIQQDENIYECQACPTGKVFGWPHIWSSKHANKKCWNGVYGECSVPGQNNENLNTPGKCKQAAHEYEWDGVYKCETNSRYNYYERSCKSYAFQKYWKMGVFDNFHTTNDNQDPMWYNHPHWTIAGQTGVDAIFTGNYLDKQVPTITHKFGTQLSSVEECGIKCNNEQKNYMSYLTQDVGGKEVGYCYCTEGCDARPAEFSEVYDSYFDVYEFSENRQGNEPLCLIQNTHQLTPGSTGTFGNIFQCPPGTRYVRESLQTFEDNVTEYTGNSQCDGAPDAVGNVMHDSEGRDYVDHFTYSVMTSSSECEALANNEGASFWSGTTLHAPLGCSRDISGGTVYITFNDGLNPNPDYHCGINNARGEVGPACLCKTTITRATTLSVDPDDTNFPDNPGRCPHCPAGYFSDKWNAVECKACPAGYWQANVNSSGCIRCAPGKSVGSTANTNQEACEICPPGRKGPSPNENTGCQECPKGTFQTQSGTYICYDCPVHTSNDHTGLSEKCTLSPHTYLPGQHAEWAMVDGALNESYYYYEKMTGTTIFSEGTRPDSFFDLGFTFVDENENCPSDHTKLSTQTNLGYYGLPEHLDVEWVQNAFRQITTQHAQIKKSGYCADDELENILTEGECKTFAQQRGFTFDTSAINSMELPTGCYQDDGGKIYFNHATHSNSPCSDYSACVCYKMDHTIKMEGTCNDDERVNILVQQECELLASSLGQTFSGAVSGSSTRPPGCYAWVDYGTGAQQFYFNPYVSSTFPCNARRACVCRKCRSPTHIHSLEDCERSASSPSFWKGQINIDSKPYGCIVDNENKNTYWNLKTNICSWYNSDFSYILTGGQLISKSTGVQKRACFPNYANPLLMSDCTNYAKINTYKMCDFYAVLAGYEFIKTLKQEPNQMSGCIKHGNVVQYNEMGFMDWSDENTCASAVVANGHTYGGSLGVNCQFTGCRSFDWDPDHFYFISFNSETALPANHIDNAPATCNSSTTNTDYETCKAFASIFGTSLTTERNKFSLGPRHGFICPKDLTGTTKVSNMAEFETQANNCDNNDGLWFEKINEELCAESMESRQLDSVSNPDKKEDCAQRCSDYYGSAVFSLDENTIDPDRQCLCSVDNVCSSISEFKEISTSTCQFPFKGIETKHECELRRNQLRPFSLDDVDPLIFYPPPPPTTTYEVQTSGTCNLHIDNIDECVSAIQSLGFTRRVIAENTEYWPKGCYIYSGGDAYFNTYDSADGCSSSSRQCVCVVTHPPTNFDQLFMFEILKHLCSDVFADMINDEIECEARADQLKVNFAIYNLNSDWPPGCFLNYWGAGANGASMIFNTGSGEPTQCNGQDKQCQCKATQQTPSLIYGEIANSNCNMHGGWNNIIDYDECEYRASLLGGSAEVETENAYPPGCYKWTTTSGLTYFYFNQQFDSTATCTSSLNCMCKRMMKPMHTFTGSIVQETIEDKVCEDWFNPFEGPGSKTELWNTAWDTPELCMERCRKFVPTATAMFIVDGNKCGCSESGTCSVKVDSNRALIYNLETNTEKTGCLYDSTTDKAVWNSEGSGTSCDSSQGYQCLCKRDGYSLITPFKERTSGNCSDEDGWIRITSKDDCQKAIDFFNLGGSYQYSTSIASSPSGCVQQSTNFILNVLDTDVQCSPAMKCLCKTDFNYRTYEIRPVQLPMSYPTFTKCNGEFIEFGDCYHPVDDIKMCEAVAGTVPSNVHQSTKNFGCSTTLDGSFVYNTDTSRSVVDITLRKPPYTVISEGNCEGYYEQITSVADCDSAADYIGFPDTSATSKSYTSSYPSGCWYNLGWSWPSTPLEFNTATSTGSCSHHNAFCFCKLKTTKPPFQKAVGSNTCEGDYDFITDIDDCATAAVYFGLVTKTPQSSAVYDDLPNGCSFDRSESTTPLKFTSSYILDPLVDQDVDVLCKRRPAVEKYKVLFKGTCYGDYGFISSQQECDSAISNLNLENIYGGLTSATSSSVNVGNLPSGCLNHYVYGSEGSAYFNSENTSVECTAQYACICKEARPYKIAFDGQCTDDLDYEYVDNLEDCESAADYLGIPDTSATSSSDTQTYPKGCWYKTTLILNTAASSKNCGDSQSMCLCKRRVAPIMIKHTSVSDVQEYANGKCFMENNVGEPSIGWYYDNMDTSNKKQSCARSTSLVSELSMGLEYEQGMCSPVNSFSDRVVCASGFESYTYLTVPHTATYEVQTSGTCNLHIDNIDECVSAIQSLGFTRIVTAENTEYWPKGCYIYSSSAAFFNTYDSTSGCSSSSSQCVCVQKSLKTKLDQSAMSLPATVLAKSTTVSDDIACELLCIDNHGFYFDEITQQCACWESTCTFVATHGWTSFIIRDHVLKAQWSKKNITISSGTLYGAYGDIVAPLNVSIQVPDKLSVSGGEICYPGYVSPSNDKVFVGNNNDLGSLGYECVPCPAGTFESSGVCIMCNEATYSAAGQRACCSNFQQYDSVSGTCVNCAGNQYSRFGEECRNCPYGTKPSIVNPGTCSIYCQGSCVEEGGTSSGCTSFVDKAKCVSNGCRWDRTAVTNCEMTIETFINPVEDWPPSVQMAGDTVQRYHNNIDMIGETEWALKPDGTKFCRIPDGLYISEVITDGVSCAGQNKVVRSTLIKEYEIEFNLRVELKRKWDGSDSNETRVYRTNKLVYIDKDGDGVPSEDLISVPSDFPEQRGFIYGCSASNKDGTSRSNCSHVESSYYWDNSNPTMYASHCETGGIPVSVSSSAASKSVYRDRCAAKCLEQYPLFPGFYFNEHNDNRNGDACVCESEDSSTCFVRYRNNNYDRYDFGKKFTEKKSSVLFDCDDTDPEKSVIDFCGECGGDGAWIDPCGQCNGVGILDPSNSECLRSNQIAFGPRDIFMGKVHVVDNFESNRIALRNDTGIITVDIDLLTPDVLRTYVDHGFLEWVENNGLSLYWTSGTDKVLDTDCYGSGEIKMYDGDGDNPGSVDERANRCAAACIQNHLGIAGFKMDPNTGECSCEPQDTLTCTRSDNRWYGLTFWRYNFNYSQGIIGTLQKKNGDCFCDTCIPCPHVNETYHVLDANLQPYTPHIPMVFTKSVCDTLVHDTLKHLCVNDLEFRIYPLEDAFMNCERMGTPAATVCASLTQLGIIVQDIQMSQDKERVCILYVNETNEADENILDCRPYNQSFVSHDVDTPPLSMTVPNVLELPTWSCVWNSFEYFDAKDIILALIPELVDCEDRERTQCGGFYCVWSDREWGQQIEPPDVEGWVKEFYTVEINATYGNWYYANYINGHTQWDTPDPIKTGCLSQHEKYETLCAEKNTKEGCTAETPHMNLCIWRSNTVWIKSDGIRFKNVPRPYGKHVFENLSNEHFGLQAYYKLNSTTTFSYHNVRVRFSKGNTIASNLKKFSLDPITKRLCWIPKNKDVLECENQAGLGYIDKNPKAPAVFFQEEFPYDHTKTNVETTLEDMFICDGMVFHSQVPDVESCAFACYKNDNYLQGHLIMERSLSGQNNCFCSGVECKYSLTNSRTRDWQFADSEYAHYSYIIHLFSYYTGVQEWDANYRPVIGVIDTLSNGYLLTRWHSILRPRSYSSQYEVTQYTEVANALGRCVQRDEYVTCDYSTRGSLILHENAWKPMCELKNFCTSSIENDLVSSARCFTLTDDECERLSPFTDVIQPVFNGRGKLIAASNTGHCMRDYESSELQCWYIQNLSLPESDFRYNDDPIDSNFKFLEGRVSMTDSKTCVAQYYDNGDFYQQYYCWPNGGPKKVGSFFVLSTMTDEVAIGMSSHEVNTLVNTTDSPVGCMHPDACNFKEYAGLNADYGHPDACWYPFDHENYTCGENARSPVFDTHTQSYRVNPGQCLYNDTNNNGWCDHLDEVFGCLDVTACNSGVSESPESLKRTIGSECFIDAQCISGHCAVCLGERKCAKKEYVNGKPDCMPEHRNFEVVTSHISSFCRYPYSEEFLCKENDVLFSSLQGVAIPNGVDSVDAYVKSSKEVRESMIRCIDIPEAHRMCKSIRLDECNSPKRAEKTGNLFFPTDACCSCGGGRVFDTSRGKPVFDIGNTGRPSAWQEEGCPIVGSCNYNPFAHPTKSLRNCNKQDSNNDGICDDVFDALEQVCNVFSASNFEPKIDPITQYVDKGVCIFDETMNEDQCTAYAPRVGCTFAGGCNFNNVATEDDGSCILPEHGHTCDGVKIIDELTYCNGQTFIPNGTASNCSTNMIEGERCYPTCNEGFTPVNNISFRICEGNGQLSEFSCERRCPVTEFWNTRAFMLMPNLTFIFNQTYDGQCQPYSMCEEFETQLLGGTAFSDVTCRPNTCFCSFGTPVDNEQCYHDGQELCKGGCHPGYHLDPETMVCVENECVCDNGKLSKMNVWVEGSCKDEGLDEEECKLAAHEDYWTPHSCRNQVSAYCKDALNVTDMAKCLLMNHTEWVSFESACNDSVVETIDDIWTEGYCQGNVSMDKDECEKKPDVCQMNSSNITTWIPGNCSAFQVLPSLCPGVPQFDDNELECNSVADSLTEGYCSVRKTMCEFVPTLNNDKQACENVPLDHVVWFENTTNVTFESQCFGMTDYDNDKSACESVASSWDPTICSNSSLNNNEEACLEANQTYGICKNVPSLNETQCLRVHWRTPEQRCDLLGNQASDTFAITTIWHPGICQSAPDLSEEACRNVKWITGKELCEIELKNVFTHGVCQGKIMGEKECKNNAEKSWWSPAKCVNRFTGEIVAAKTEDICINNLCEEHGAQNCESCNSNAFKSGNACILHQPCASLTHEVGAPTLTSQRQCSPNICTCPTNAGVQGPCFIHNTLSCQSCYDGFFLDGDNCVRHLQCDNSTEYVLRNGTNVSNTVCGVKQCICNDLEGRAAKGKDCPEHGQEKCVQCAEGKYMEWGICKTCEQGKYLHGNTCLDLTICGDGAIEITMPTMTSDRVCSRRARCSNGIGFEILPDEHKMPDKHGRKRKFHLRRERPLALGSYHQNPNTAPKSTPMADDVQKIAEAAWLDMNNLPPSENNLPPPEKTLYDKDEFDDVKKTPAVVDVQFGFQEKIIACKSDHIRVAWLGHHNIRETMDETCNSQTGSEIIGFQNTGHVQVFRSGELAPEPGHTRYFKCDSHCGKSNARFSVYCPRKVNIFYGFNNKVIACPGDQIQVHWLGHHNIRETNSSECNNSTGTVIVPFQYPEYVKKYTNDEFVAQPTQRRYFQCDSHCGPKKARFEVFCPAHCPSIDLFSMYMDQCKHCHHGYYLKNHGHHITCEPWSPPCSNGTFELVRPTHVRDRKCSDTDFNQCKCPHGTPKYGADCPYNLMNSKLIYGQDKPQCAACDEHFQLNGSTCIRKTCEDYEFQNGTDSRGNTICTPIWEKRIILQGLNCSQIKIKYNERVHADQPSCSECKNTTYCSSLEKLWSSKDCAECAFNVQRERVDRGLSHELKKILFYGA